ncbi:MAG: DUF11 domain-containing protein [Micrococcales bacterium]|nr:DUF11 domain-containing protein [Micrococcales bacterium]
MKVLKPGIKVVKTANKSEVKPGDPVKYTFVVTNTGTDAPLKDVSLADDKCTTGMTGPVKTGGNQDALLEKGEIWTYECSQNLQNTTTNIATATGKDNLNTEVTDTDTVTVKVPAGHQGGQDRQQVGRSCLATR